jgi:hypothetical protein
VLNMGVEFGHHPAELDDLGAGADNGRQDRHQQRLA